ncbi:MAG: helix-turn-helix domain-containing protein [Rickettsiaceae bacterium]|nr:helix-turn-helix domain-containing protein [Rickettsiaceae bacterium]
MSNEKLAALLGVDEGTVANWENNRQCPTKNKNEICYFGDR